MFAVIFRAKVKIAKFDNDYASMAKALRELALTQYGCKEFTSSLEGDNEIAISYWDKLEDIQSWKGDPLHKQAQTLGAKKWYQSYQVQVLEVLREYESPD